MKEIRKAFLFLLPWLLLACGKTQEAVPDAVFASPPSLSQAQRALFCKPTQIQNVIPERKFLGQRFSATMSFADLRDSINSACMSCHKAPSNTAGVSYTDTYLGQELTLGGVTRYYPGISEVAKDFSAAIFHSNPKKQMPPEDRRKNNPEAFLQIGKNIDAWIKAGKPQGLFTVEQNDESPAPVPPIVSSSEIGDCTPDPKIIGFDYKRDRLFENADKLPKNLLDTDLFSLDSFELAQRGTVAYNVEYPLWADNAEKGRWIHVPMKREGNKLVRQSIAYNDKTKNFEIPENTRVYKNFYKLIKQKDGTLRYRRMETRIIVVRYPSEKALFGSYRWDEAEQVATLVDTPYRDGTPFKDVVFPIVIDEVKNKTRIYGIPAKHRCIECHSGSETKSFTLGFTPLQINRRLPGEYGRNPNIGTDELSLANRLVQYGVVSGFERSEQLPRLEWTGREHPRNIFEFKAQSYFVGNCAHCHNPNGFAFKNDVNLELTPGAIFNFNPFTPSSQIPNRVIVSSSGDLSRSQIYSKVYDPPEQQGLTSRMPMHTPGSPDCEALRAIGKWVRSFESIDAAKEWEPDCKPVEDIAWVDQDFTWPVSDHYVPRRNDWNDPVVGMPQKFRDLQLTENLNAVINKKFAVGYWNAKENCKFPPVQLKPEEVRPWMVKNGQPKRPFGELYFTTPGSWYFRTTCMKCHGPHADGNTALARGILNWSGGSVRVADLANGLFGKNGENLRTFDSNDGLFGSRNLGGNYLIWMAMEGTRVKFPPQASSILGRHGGQMLNQIRDKCIRQISPDKASSPNFPDHEIFREVCFQNNTSANDPRLKFDPVTGKPLNPEFIEEWADRGAYNAGWAIYQFLSDAGRGKWQPGNDECEAVFPK